MIKTVLDNVEIPVGDAERLSHPLWMYDLECEQHEYADSETYWERREARWEMCKTIDSPDLKKFG